MKQLVFSLALILCYTSGQAQLFKKKGKQKEEEPKIVISTGLGNEEPTKENVLKVLENFPWDATTQTHKNEAYRILTHLQADYEHYMDYPTGEGFVCGKLPSGYYLTIFTDSYGKKDRYHVRYGKDANHAYFSKQGYSDASTYDILKKTDASYSAQFPLVDAATFKEDTSLGILFGFSHALAYMANNPVELLSEKMRTELLTRVIWDVLPHNTNEFENPIILSKEHSHFKKGDIIVGRVQKGKLDRIHLDNVKRKLLKEKDPLTVVVFRQDQFMLREFNPKSEALSFIENKEFQTLVFDYRHKLVDYILASGAIDWSMNTKHILGGGFGEVSPLIGAVVSPYRYSSYIVDQLVKYGADVHVKDKYNNTPLHVAAGRFYHYNCYYYDHKKSNDKGGSYAYRGSEDAYFHLISLGASDTVKGLYHKKLEMSTPKEFYFLTFKNAEHITRPDDFDWNAVANAVIKGTVVAVQEKQRQINEANAITKMNQDYTNKVNARIQNQKDLVTKKNTDYYNRINKKTDTNLQKQPVVKVNPSTDVNKTKVPSPNTSMPIPTNKATVKKTPVNQGGSKINQTETEEELIWYGFRGAIDPDYVKELPHVLGEGTTIIGYRNQWVLYLTFDPVSKKDLYIPKLKKVEVLEMKSTFKTSEIPYRMGLIKSNERLFYSKNEALYAPIEDKPGIYWTLDSAKQAAAKRNQN